jgi:hypothetical protein
VTVSFLADDNERRRRVEKIDPQLADPLASGSFSLGLSVNTTRETLWLLDQYSSSSHYESIGHRSVQLPRTPTDGVGGRTTFNRAAVNFFFLRADSGSLTHQQVDD